MIRSLRRAHPAMGTWFEAILRGGDVEHLDAVASAVFDEIDRVERLLSRFDPKSEVARVNREASAHPIVLDYELLGVLLTCRIAWQETGGGFDVTASIGQGVCSFDAVEIDPDRRTVSFRTPGLALDLGGIGKGYALDRAAEILRAQGVENALMHGGTSSVLALGGGEEGSGWVVGVRDPFRPHGEAPERFRVRLADRGFSCSAVFGHNQEESDLIDPRFGRPLTEPAGCVVLADSATRAEVWSTALLAIGRAGAAGFVERLSESGTQAAWIAAGEDGPTWEWITP